MIMLDNKRKIKNIDEMKETEKIKKWLIDLFCLNSYRHRVIDKIKKKKKKNFV
jgi:hypothetical protein